MRIQARGLPRTNFFALTLALGLILCGSAWAEERISGDVSKGIDPESGENLIPPVDVQEKNLIDVIRFIEETANVNILVDDALQDVKITLHLQRAMSWLDTIKVIADVAEADIRVITEHSVRLYLPPRVALEFRDAPVKDAIRTIARVSNKNIVIPSNIAEVDELITLNLRNVAWDDALNVVVKSAGLVAVEDAGGKVVRIAHPRELRKQLETQIFRLRYLRPQGEYRAIFASGAGIGTGDSEAGGGSRTFVERFRLRRGDIVDRFPLLGALKKALTLDEDGTTEIGKIDYDEVTNTLIVRDQRTNINDISDIVQEIDLEPIQIQIDMKFITTSNTDILDFGVDIFSDGLQVTGSLGAFTHRLPFNIGEGGWEDSLQLGPPGTDRDQTFTANSQFQFGSLDFTGVNAALRILKRDVQTRILQAPKVVALDGRPATIFVGEEVRYAESEAIINDLGASTVTVAEAEDSPVQVGFQLLVIPHVVRGTNKVMMTVIPANTALTGPFNGFDRFLVAGQLLELPRLSSSTVVTSMVVQNGQTAVIGGLYTENESSTVDKVPVLGDIPILGYGFKNRSSNSARSNLIIFITPRIVRDYEQTEEFIQSFVSRRTESQAVDLVREFTDRDYVPPEPPEDAEGTEQSPESPSSGPDEQR